MRKLFRFINTIKYLKFKQIYFRIYYAFRDFLRKSVGFTYTLTLPSGTTQLALKKSLVMSNIFDKNEFTFLNKIYKFGETINWNYSGYGKLWTYNLNYFDFLHQEVLSKDDGLYLINNFIDHSYDVKDGLEAFPISLRGINWIKFLMKYNIDNKNINDSLYAQYQILMDNIEYHLLGNHLFENGFSLLFGAYYFQDERFYDKAKKILTDELEEQILQDGAHFELSPMYHQLMLFRVLDCINLVQNNNWKNQELLSLLISKAEIMLGWLNTITYENGNIPLLNDSANSIAPTTKELNDYALILTLNAKRLTLNSSGYRKIKNEYYEMVIDIGNIGPDYIPGHAHSDTFNFELYKNGKPFIIDTGISTYETNSRRQEERSTKAHNTVTINNTDQSEIWAGFRVANRAKIVNIIEEKGYISAKHNGYQKKFRTIHQREYFYDEKNIKIVDTIHSKNKKNLIARIHFTQEIEIKKEGNTVWCDDVQIVFSSDSIKIKEYTYSVEFNQQISSKMLEIMFPEKLTMEIKI